MNIRLKPAIAFLALSCFHANLNASPLDFELLATMPSSSEMILLRNSLVSEPSSEGTLVEQLSEQGKNSYANYRYDLARGALRRVLAIEPNNLEANYYLGLMFVDGGETEQVSKTLATIPNESMYYQLLVNYNDIYNQRSSEYQRAKLLAKAGRYQLALEQYQQLFQYGIPTPDIALDYLIIESKIDATKASAIRGLHQLNLQFNNVTRYQIELADHLSNDQSNYQLKRTIYNRYLNDNEFGKHAAKSWLKLIDDLPASPQSVTDIALIETTFADDREIVTEATKMNTTMVASLAKKLDPLYQGKRAATQLYEQGAYAQAKAKVDALISKNHSDDELLGLLGHIEAQLGNSYQSMQAYSRAAAKATDLQTRRDWQTLGDESAYWTTIALAEQSMKAEDYVEAQQRYSQAVTLLPNYSNAYNGLGDAYYQRGKYQSALDSYRLALTHERDSSIALAGEFNSLLKLRGITTALDNYANLSSIQQQRIESLVNTAKLEQELRNFDQALAQGEASKARDIVDTLLTFNVTNPWVRREIAQALVSVGEEDKASTMMATWFSQSNDPDMAHAYSLYLSSLGRLNDAIDVLNSIDIVTFSPAMSQTLQRLKLEQSLTLITQQYDSDHNIANSQVQNLLSEYRSTPLSRFSILRQWFGLGETYRASVALQADMPLATDSASIQLEYLALLVEFGLWEAFEATSNEWRYPNNDRLTPVQQAQWHQLSTQYELARADLWRDEGNPQKAIALYKRVLKRSAGEVIPVKIALLSAIIDKDGTTKEALDLGDSLYERRKTVDTQDAIELARLLDAMGRTGESKTLLSEVSIRSDSDRQRMSELLAIAVASRYWDLAQGFASRALIPDANGKSDDDTLYLAYQDASKNELGRNIRGSIDTMQEESNTDIAIGYQTSQNKSKNILNTIPIEVNFPIDGVDGRFFVRADVLTAETGDISYIDYDNNENEISLNQTESGHIVGVGFRGEAWSGDIGLLEFGKESTLIGGVTLPVALSDLSVDLTLSRRPVTSTVVSYAGLTTPGGAIQADADWGSVTKTGLKIDLSYDQGGRWGSWMSGQIHQLNGNNVEDNQRLALLGGIYHKVINADDERLSFGANGLLLSYDNNQDEYSYGLGGYYSPQQYLSVSLPVNYAKRVVPNLLFWGGVGVSYSTVSDDGVINTDDASSSSQSIGFSGELGLETRLANHWDIGLKLSAQYSEDYEPFEIQLYSRYYLNALWGDGDLTPNTITRYAEFD
jgi:tetratricopeptide (TPR) repeat protein/opacity protein-like surface antigen